jgi:hypothetical protein
LWQEIMLRQLYGTYISISSIETTRKSWQKQRGPTVSPLEWRQNQSMRENRPPCGVRKHFCAWQTTLSRNSESLGNRGKDEIVKRGKKSYLMERNTGQEYYPFDTIRLVRF